VPVAGVGVPFVPVSKSAAVEERSETKRLASKFADNTLLRATRQSALIPAELRVLMRGELGSWNCCRYGRLNEAPVLVPPAL
jgi:hypothetical protein